MKAVIYTRISTSKQDELSLEAQEDKCRKQADLLEYRDFHYQRPAAQKAVAIVS